MDSIVCIVQISPRETAPNLAERTKKDNVLNICERNETGYCPACSELFFDATVSQETRRVTIHRGSSNSLHAMNGSISRYSKHVYFHGFNTAI